MAGRGSDDEETGGTAPDGQSFRAAADVPSQVLRSWDLAEARLFPLVMARPEVYERSLALIQSLLRWLRDSCPDVPALLAAAGRGADLITEAARGAPEAGRGAPDPDFADAGLPLAEIAAAACAMRYRELAAAAAARTRIEAFARAGARPGSWAVVEESGDQARAPYLPYQRVEAHIPSGRAMIISIEPDETLSRAVWRLDEAMLDPGTGRLDVGDSIGSYASAEDCDAALASSRERLS
jgi:hypothetical protein